MSKVIGIDLGTTNSCVAVLEGGEPVVIPNSEGGRTTPSVVSFTQAGERVVGEAAKRQQAVNAARTVLSIKREMGTDYRVKIDGKAYTPQEISAMILQKLRRDAEAFSRRTGEPGGHHRPGVFYGQPAAGHARRGAHCGAGSSAHHQRADGGGVCLRPRPRAGAEDSGLRPRRRHVRRVADRNRRRRDRGAGDERRQPSRRRRL